MTTTTNRQPIGGRTLGLCFLLALSAFINYVDRGSLSVAAPLLKGELHLTAAQLGNLLGAFFLTYTAMMVFTGWMVDRFHVGWLLAGGLVVWSLATVATGLVSGFIGLLCFRMLLGAGEAVAFPAYGKILAQHVAEEHRGVANAMIITGMSLGPAVGTLICGSLMAAYGWRPAFIVLGLGSLLWLVPWLRWMPQAAENSERTVCPASFKDILGRRAFWGTGIGQFCSQYPFYLLILWLPFYLVSERHFSMTQMARETATFFFVYAAGAPLIAWIADSFIRRGTSANVIRKSSMVIGHLVVVGGVLGLAGASAGTTIWWLIIMAAGYGFVGPNLLVFAQTLAGPAVAGRWTGLQNTLGNLVGLVVGPLTGLVVDRTGHFWWPFVLAAAFMVLGGLSWVLLTGPLTRMNWPGETRDSNQSPSPAPTPGS